MTICRRLSAVLYLPVIVVLVYLFYFLQVILEAGRKMTKPKIQAKKSARVITKSMPVIPQSRAVKTPDKVIDDFFEVCYWEAEGTRVILTALASSQYTIVYMYVVSGPNTPVMIGSEERTLMRHCVKICYKLVKLTSPMYINNINLVYNYKC